MDAIRDGNVLPLRIDCVGTVKAKADVSDARVRAIDTEKALNAPERIREVTLYIVNHFD